MIRIIGILILYTVNTFLCLLENSQLIKSYTKTKWYIVIILNLTGLKVQFYYIMIAPNRGRRSSSCICYYAVHTQWRLDKAVQNRRRYRNSTFWESIVLNDFFAITIKTTLLYVATGIVPKTAQVDYESLMNY